MSKITKLKEKFSFTIYPKLPYSFDSTIHKPSHFPSSDNEWEKGKYWITIVWQNKIIGLKLKDNSTKSHPKIKATIYSEKPLGKELIDSIIPELKHRFNTESNVLDFFKFFKKEKLLAPLIKKYGAMKPVAANSFYEILVIYIVLQNATVRRTHQMLENLFKRFGKKVEFNGKTLSAFWKPEIMAKASEQELRDLKLGYRAKFLKRISEQFAKGEIDEFKIRNLTKEEAKKEALKLYGIGKASVEYLLFEDFYHYDALETIPPWEQKILSRILYKKKLVPADKILKDAEKRWGKWKKLAVHYIWEDIFWQRKTQRVDWLEKEIRL